MSDLREKAVEAFCHADGGTRYIDGPALEAIHAVVDICMEEAAKATCSSCAKGWLLNDSGYHVPPKGYSTWPCHAAAIRSLKGGGDG